MTDSQTGRTHSVKVIASISMRCFCVRFIRFSALFYALSVLGIVLLFAVFLLFFIQKEKVLSMFDYCYVVVVVVACTLIHQHKLLCTCLLCIVLRFSRTILC
jgi:hypothetical protein